MKNTDLELLKGVRGFYQAHVTSLNGILDKLPEGLRGDLKVLHDSLNEQLSKLMPLEQVPAAQEAGWALNALGETLCRMQEYANGLVQRLTGLSNELSGKVTALHGFEERVKQGDLVPKDSAAALVQAAESRGREAAEKELLPLLAATRKSGLELAGLPLPADDKVLVLPQDKYEARVASAKETVKTLAARGVKAAAFVQRTAWLEGTELAGQMALVDELCPGRAGETELNGKSGAGAVDPLLGNKPAGDAPANEAQGQRIYLV